MRLEGKSGMSIARRALNSYQAYRDEYYAFIDLADVIEKDYHDREMKRIMDWQAKSWLKRFFSKEPFYRDMCGEYSPNNRIKKSREFGQVASLADLLSRELGRHTGSPEDFFLNVDDNIIIHLLNQ